MKVLLHRALFLGGVYYEPNQAGTDLPDNIGDRKVMLFSEAAKAQVKKATEEAAADGKPYVPPVILPRGVSLWNDKAAKDWQAEGPQLIKSATPPTPVAMSEMLPGASKAEQKAAK